MFDDSHSRLILSATLTGSYTHPDLIDLRNAESVSIHTVTSHNGSGIYPSGTIQMKASSQYWKNYPSKRVGDKPTSFINVPGMTDVLSGSSANTSIINKFPVADAFWQWTFIAAPGVDVTSGSANVYVIVKGPHRP